MKNAAYHLGLKTQEKEITEENLRVRGSIPKWLEGTLISTGPAKFEVGNSSYNHWFDGLAMLHKFSFKDQKVDYSCKYVESDAYRKAMEKEKIVYGEFGTDPCQDIFQKVASFFRGQAPTDNVCVNINLHGDGLTSKTESVTPVSFDLDTLETKGHFKFTDDLDGQITTAHPHYDADGTLFSYITKFGRESEYKLYSQKLKSHKRDLITSIPTEAPAYMHSLGMTENFMILTEFPLIAKPLKFRFSSKPFIEKFEWKPENGTKIHLVSKNTGAVESFKAEPFFSFHHVNAFEKDDAIIFDLVAHRDADIIKDFYLKKLRSHKPVKTAGELWRFSLWPGEKKVTRKLLSSTLLELPRINYHKINTKQYNFVYGAGTIVRGNFNDSIVKTDISRGESLIWQEPDCYPGEPVFIEEPGAKNEDDGILLSVVLDAGEKNSFLLVLDAKNMEEIARARVSLHVPFGFHGQYVESEAPEQVIKTIHR